MTYLLLFILGLIAGVFLLPIVIYLRAKHSGWDDSNFFNVLRALAHLMLHPSDFCLMQYPNGKKPFWYLTKDEFSEVVNSRPNNNH